MENTMNLILYKSTEKQFTDNGLGILSDAYNAGVHEVQNGEFTLTFSYPVNGVRFSDIKTDNIVTAKPNSTDSVHAFRIFSTVPDFFNKYVIVTAESITNDLLGKVVKGFSETGSGVDVFKRLATNAGLDSTMMIQSDLTDSHTISVETTNVLATVVAAATKTWTGEIKRENNMVSMMKRRGRDYPMKFSLGKNIQGIKITSTTGDVVAGIIPYTRYSNDSGQPDTLIFGDLVKSAHYNDYANPRVTNVAIQGRRSSDTSADKSLPIIDNKTQLNAAAATWFGLQDNIGIDQPSVSVAIDVVSVQQTTDYTIFPNNVDVGLFDKVLVDLSDYDISLDMTVSEITYDPIKERVSTIVLGDLGKRVTSDLAATIEKISQIKDVAYDAVANANNANQLSSLASEAAQSATQDARSASAAADLAHQGAAQAQQAASDASNTAFQAQSAANKATDIANQTSAALDTTNAMAAAASSMASAATSAAGDARNAASSASSMASQANESLQQTLNDVKTAQETANLAKNQAENNATVAQSAVDVANTVKQQFGDLSVGGRNYVLNSSGINGSPTVRPTLSGTSSGSNATITYPSDGILMTNGATNTTTEWYYQVANAWAKFSDTPLNPGDQITFSAEVRGTVPQAVLRYGFNGGSGIESFKSFDINNKDWTRVSITIKSNPNNTGLYFRIQGGINNQYATGWSGGETLKFRYVKIEKGNQPTDWSPAPEDVDTEISHTTTYGTTAPSNPQNGAVWFDTSQNPNVEKRYNSTTKSWIVVQFSAYNIAAKAVTAEKIDTYAVTAQAIAAGAIDASKIQAGTITGAQMAAHTITAALIDATDLHVYAANIDGKLTANQIDTTNLYVGGANVMVPDPADSTGNTLISTSELAIRQTNQISQNQVNINNGLIQASADMQDYVNGQVDPLRSGLDNLNGYVRIINGVIYLGDSSNPVVLALDNDGISFISGDTILAQFNDKSLSITDQNASLRLGKFAFQPRANGNLSFVWIDE